YVERDGTPTIAYVAATRSSGGAVTGAVVFWVAAEALWDAARRLDGAAGAGSFAVIYDKLGIRIAHTSSRDIVFHPGGRLPIDVVDRLVAEARFGPRTRELLDDVRSFPEQFDRARAERPAPDLFRGVAPVNEQVNYGVGRRFATAPWTVFYMVPEDTLTAPIAGIARERIALTSVLAIFAIVIALWFARAIARPIGALAE